MTPGRTYVVELNRTPECRALIGCLVALNSDFVSALPQSVSNVSEPVIFLRSRNCGQSTIRSRRRWVTCCKLIFGCVVQDWSLVWFIRVVTGSEICDFTYPFPTVVPKRGRILGDETLSWSAVTKWSGLCTSVFNVIQANVYRMIVQKSKLRFNGSRALILFGK